MSTASNIRRFVNRLKYGQIFTSRDILSCGRRGAIDQAVYRFVKIKYIYRLARGVFIKAKYANEYVVSQGEIAAIKALSFGKQILSHGHDVAYHFGLSKEGNDFPCFATNGASSSFQFNGVRIQFKHVCARKMRLAESKAGATLRALWHLGRSWYLNRSQIIHSQLCALSGDLLRPERQELRALAALTPAWLNDDIVRPDYNPPGIPEQNTDLYPAIIEHMITCQPAFPQNRLFAQSKCLPRS